MSKKVKIGIKDIEKLEFFINEDALKNDYFSLKDLMGIDYDEVSNFIKKELESKKEEYVKQIRNEIYNNESRNIINDFKQSNEYKELYDLKIKFNSLESSLRDKMTIEFSNKLNDLKLEKQEEINKINLEKVNEIKIKEDEFKNKYENIIKAKDDEIVELKRIRKGNSTKQMGENFEDWIENEIRNHFNSNQNVLVQKATETKYNNKPDFIFSITNGSDIQKIIIEAKTQGDTGETKNKTHFQKLDNDRKNNDGIYSILVTELEPEIEFTIQRVNQYQNMFMVRPEYLNVLLDILSIICLKEMKINNDFKNKQMNFEERSKIFHDFNDLKSSIIDTYIKNIESKVNDIIKESEKVIDSGQKIKKYADVVIDTHLSNIRSKLEKFNIEAKIKKIEKLENSN